MNGRQRLKRVKSEEQAREWFERETEAGIEFNAPNRNYRDTNHYMPNINDWMVGCFVRGEDIVTAENRKAFEEKLIENTRIVKERYADLFQ